MTGTDMAHGPGPSLPRPLVDAGDTWERINRLLEHGVTRKEVARHVTGRVDACRLRLSHDLVPHATAAKVQALHEAILGCPGGENDPTCEPGPDRRRFPVAPLLEVAAKRHMSDRALADTARIRIDRARRIGLNPIQADRAATALGLHPDSLWPTYTDGGNP